MYRWNHKITDSNFVGDFTELLHTIRIEKMIVSVEKIKIKLGNYVQECNLQWIS